MKEIDDSLYKRQQVTEINTQSYDYTIQESYRPMEVTEPLTGFSNTREDLSPVLGELGRLRDFFEGTGLSLKEDTAMLIERLEALVESCDNYLKTDAHGTQKARYGIVSRIAERADRDISELLKKEKLFERMRPKGRVELLSRARTLELSEASGMTQLFREEEKLRSPKLGELIDERKERIGGADDHGGYSMAMLSAMKAELCSDPAVAKAALRAFYGFRTSPDGFYDLKKVCDILYLPRFGELKRTIGGIEKIADTKEKNEIKEAVGRVFSEVRKALIMADVGTNTARISAGEGLAKRNTATYRLAELLGQKELVQKCEQAAVTTGGQVSYGVVTEEGTGVEARELYQRRDAAYSPGAIRDLFNLQIFDALCGQTDRHSGNIMLGLRESGEKPGHIIDSATGMHSDYSFGKLNYSDIMSEGYSMIRRIEDREGLLSSPAVSRELSESILALTPDMMAFELVGLLSKKEGLALTDRLVGIQETIKRQTDHERAHRGIPSKLIEKDGWGVLLERLKSRAGNDSGYGKWLGVNTYINPGVLAGRRYE